MLVLSQVIFAVSDLLGTRERFEALGFSIVDGGKHPGLGTANSVIPLGAQYIELLGVVDRDQAAANPFGRAVLQRAQHGDRLARWSLRTDGIEDNAEDLHLAVEARSRITPTGQRLTWRVERGVTGSRVTSAARRGGVAGPRCDGRAR